MQLKSKFPLGQVVATPGALEALGHIEAGTLLLRHSFGDWGDVCEESALLNDEALQDGSRLLSIYKSNNGTKIYILTEADRSATTILLPSEY